MKRVQTQKFEPGVPDICWPFGNWDTWMVQYSTVTNIYERIEGKKTFSRSSLCVANSWSSFFCLALSSLISSSSCFARPSWVAASSFMARYSCLLSDALCLSFSSDRLSCVCSVLRQVICHKKRKKNYEQKFNIQVILQILKRRKK